MKVQIESRVGKWTCRYGAEIDDSKVEAAMKRTAALAFAASLASKQAGGKIADFSKLGDGDITKRHEASGKAGGDFVFSDLSISAWTPSVGADPIARAVAALKSGRVSDTQKAELAAMLATLE